jgi:ATP-dependent Clp protease ATP-binding subunit ClpC
VARAIHDALRSCDVLLAITDNGYLTDSTGRQGDFRRTFIIMTSNAGCEGAGRRAAEAVRALEQYEMMKDNVLTAMRKLFPPELLNLIDATVADAAREILVEKGFDPVFGARPMIRSIQNLIEDPLNEGLLHGRFMRGEVILIDRSGDDVTLETEHADGSC